MNNNRYRKSRLAKSLWMGMAVFFMIFCSCPVKRYIRQQLYRHRPYLERTAGAHASTNDIKDCSIAERHEQSQIQLLSFVAHPSDPHQVHFFHGTADFAFTPVAYAETGHVINAKCEPRGNAMPIPVYLWVRHLQV